jgi:hypothetical protein
MTKIKAKSERVEYFASIDRKGEIALVTKAFPLHELVKGQIELSEQEYELLCLLSTKRIYEMDALNMLTNIQGRIKAYQKEKK